MIAKIITSLIALLVGGWMIFDGIYVLATGKYFGPEKPGLWSDLIGAIGVDPFKLGPLFIAFGLLWLFFLTAMLLRQSWGWQAARFTAFLTLWYLPVGTVLSLLYILLLFLFRSTLQETKSSH
jgi:hypothetical protein